MSRQFDPAGEPAGQPPGRPAPPAAAYRSETVVGSIAAGSIVSPAR